MSRSFVLAFDKQTSTPTSCMPSQSEIGSSLSQFESGLQSFAMMEDEKSISLDDWMSPMSGRTSSASSESGTTSRRCSGPSSFIHYGTSGAAVKQTAEERSQRRRMQNRHAQRAYRDREKRRVDELQQLLLDRDLKQRRLTQTLADRDQHIEQLQLQINNLENELKSMQDASSCSADDFHNFCGDLSLSALFSTSPTETWMT